LSEDKVIEELLTVLFARGHALIISVPGLAKTLLVKTLAGTLGWQFKRIQFTPDLMPSDITGTEILQTDQQVEYISSFQEISLDPKVETQPSIH
jgi:MoxR-like ATPase